MTEVDAPDEAQKIMQKMEDDGPYYDGPVVELQYGDVVCIAQGDEKTIWATGADDGELLVDCVPPNAGKTLDRIVKLGYVEYDRTDSYVQSTIVRLL